MMKSTKEQEEAVGKLKSDLEAKKRKLEEDKTQESRSDPESVTSSLTRDTNASHRHSRLNATGTKKQKLSQEVAQQQDNATLSHNISKTNEESSGGDDRASRGGGTFDNTVGTGVSDITDSNRGSSSSNNSASGSGKTESVSNSSADDKKKTNQPTTGSISNDAAVANEKSSQNPDAGGQKYCHKDVVFNSGKRQHRKRPAEEQSSLEGGFGLDYKEVFKMSNVPQFVATTSGKIVAWNRCFLRALGIRRSEVERMTIFSLVRPEKLFKFFEIVSHALRDEADENAEQEPPTVAGAGEKGAFEDKSTGETTTTSSATRNNYSAMTLPCIDFPGLKKRKTKDPSFDPGQLHLTVSLRFMTIARCLPRRILNAYTCALRCNRSR